MPSLWEVLKTSKGLPAPDGFTALFARSLSDTYTLAEISGIPPLNLGEIVGIVDYTIYGNTYQAEGVLPDTPQEVKGCGERTGNLFDKGNATVYEAFINVNYFWFSTTDGSKSIRIPVEPDTTYTLSMGVSPAIFRLCESDLEDPTPTGIKVSRIIYSGDISEYTFTTSSTAKFLIFQDSSTVLDKWFNTLMLNEGETALPYEPYGYKIPFTTAAEDGSESITTTAYLDNPIHKIGNYTDVLSYSGKSVERPIKELILTGDEDWKKSSNYLGNFYARVLFNLRSLGDDAYCTHATQVKIPITTEKLVYGTFATESLYDNSAIVDLFIGQPEWTVDDFKAYLKEQYNSGTPVKVYYVLAAPVTETVELPEIPTLDGTTVIDVDTEVKPSNLKIIHKSKM